MILYATEELQNRCSLAHRSKEYTEMILVSTDENSMQESADTTSTIEGSTAGILGSY